MATKEELLESIKGLSVVELNDLVKALEEEFGVSAAAPVAVVAAPGAASAGADSEEEATEFTVVLSDFGANKINVIKAVREVTNLGLREAKDLVEAAPTNIKEAVGKEEADTIKSKLEEAGASIAIQ